MGDLTQSVWDAYAKAYGGDKEKAKQAIENSKNEEEQRIKDRKVRDLQQEFPLEKEVIEKVLGDVNWDPDQAIIPLFELIERQRLEARKKEQKEQEARLEQERILRKEEAKAKAKQSLGQLFRDVPEAKIQEVLDENEGDVDATIDQLLHMLRQEEESRQQAESRRKQEEDKARRQQEMERQVKVETLRQKFGDYLVDEEIVEALQRHDWQIRQASNDLLKIVEERKLAQLKRLYSDLTVDEIKAALHANEWKLVETMKQLAALQEAKKKTREQPAAVIQTPPEIVEKPEAFMLRSALIGEELEKIVLIHQAEAEKAEQEIDPYEIVKQRFQKKIIRPDNLPGLPGMIPLTPKLIDQLHGREEKPVAEQSTSQPAPAESKPSPVSASTVLTDQPTETMRVTLQATPARADIGQEVKVEWNSEDPTSTSDWIGVYRAGSTGPASSYVTWNWIGEAKQKGVLTFTVSEFGDFEFRYFSKRQYHVRATSNTVHIGPAVELAARFDANSNSIFVKIDQKSGNVYPNAWVGMYASADSDNGSYRAFQWASTARDHEVKFVAPKAGTWHFRYFPQKSYVDVARCSAAVAGDDRLELTIKDGQMIVRTHIVTVEPGLDNVWIGIYRVEQTDPRLYRKYKYVPVGSAIGVVTFRSCTTAGEYEARLFANKSLDVVCRSNTARVGPAPNSAPSTSS